MKEKILDRAIEILSDPENWAEGYYAYDRHGLQVTSADPTACKWCLVGALRKAKIELSASIFDVKPLYDEIQTNIIGDIYYPHGGEKRLVAFNDSAETSHSDVLSLLKITKDSLLGAAE